MTDNPLDEILALVKANWLRGLPREENITKVVTRFGALNGHEERVQRELDLLYYGDFHLTDLGNTQRLVRLFGDDIRYSISRRKWLVWQGTHWRWDDEVLLMQYAKRVVKSLYEQAGKETSDDARRALAKWALTSESTSRLQAMVKSAESEEALAITDAELDADPFAFNVVNGTIDLRTGEIREHRREDYITILSPVTWDPNAAGVMWAKFLSDITAGNEDLMDYLARAVGYSMTGNAREDIVFFVYGPGSNGKSTFLATIRKMMGDYLGTVPVKALIDNTKGAPSGHRDEIATLVGTRMVLGAETPDRMKIDMGLIKALTGGDAIQVSRKYERSFTFCPTFKPWLYGNSKPRIPEIDDGTWRRLRLVPLLVQFKRGENEVTDMEERLEAELSAVLAWGVAGAVKWYREGLTDTDVVSRATSEYREEEDVAGQFLDDCTVASATGRVSKAEMYERYRQWCLDNGEVPVGTKTFTHRLRGHNVLEDKSGSVRYWDGIALHDGTDGTNGTAVPENPSHENTSCEFMKTDVPSVPSVPQSPPVTKRCHRCGSTKFWERLDGELMCSVCYPNPTAGGKS